MVVDIFGGGRADNQRTSVRGRPGRDALELSKYFPNGTAALMRKHDMSSSYVLNSKTDCELTTTDGKIKKKSYILAVKDRNLDKPRLKLLEGSKPCELNEITNPKGAKHQYSMSFNGASVYHMSVVDKNCGFFSNNKPGTGMISVVFKVQKDRPQTLLYCCTKKNSSDFPPPPPGSSHPPHNHPLREITVTNHEICIWGELNSQIHSEVIMFDLSKQFTSFCLKWEIVKNNHSGKLSPPATTSKTAYTYHIKNDSDHQTGHFRMDTMKVTPSDFYIGGRPNSRQLLMGEVHSLECFKTPEIELPKIVLDLISNTTSISRTSTTTATVMLSPANVSYHSEEEQEEEEVSANNRIMEGEEEYMFWEEENENADNFAVVPKKKRKISTAAKGCIAEIFTNRC